MRKKEKRKNKKLVRKKDRQKNRTRTTQVSSTTLRYLPLLEKVPFSLVWLSCLLVVSSSLLCGCWFLCLSRSVAFFLSFCRKRGFWLISDEQNSSTNIQSIQRQQTQCQFQSFCFVIFCKFFFCLQFGLGLNENDLDVFVFSRNFFFFASTLQPTCFSENFSQAFTCYFEQIFYNFFLIWLTKLFFWKLTLLFYFTSECTNLHDLLAE